MLKTTPLGVRVTPTLKASLDRLAAADMRSTASLVAKVLTDYVNAHGGHLPDVDSDGSAHQFTRARGRPRTAAAQPDPHRDRAIANALAGKTSISIDDLSIAMTGESLHDVAVGSEKWPPNPHFEASLRAGLHAFGWVEATDDATGALAWVPGTSL